MAIRMHSENAVLQSTGLSFYSILNGVVRADLGEPETAPMKRLTMPSSSTTTAFAWIITYLAQIFFIIYIFCFYLLKNPSVLVRQRLETHLGLL